MNGEDRRRMEILHPETIPSKEEMEEKRDVAESVLRIGKSITFTFMVIGALVIAFVSSHYRGYTGFSIALGGILLDVVLGAIIAYNLGNFMKKVYTERLKYEYNHSANL